MRFREFKEAVRKMPFFDRDTAAYLAGSPAAIRVQLSRWKKEGLIVQLKSGLYLLGENERTMTPSRQAIAAVLVQPSCISLESALSYYNLIPERVESITSVTPRKTQTLVTTMGTFIYRSLKIPLHFGFAREQDENGLPYFLAEPEKALLDLLYLNLGRLDARREDTLSGFLRLQNREILKAGKLKTYARRFGVKKLELIVKELL